MLRGIVIFYILSHVYVIGNAQFGFRLKYNHQALPGWESAVQEATGSSETVLKSGYEAGVDYWFRLKKHRVEFMPELAYGYAASDITAGDLITVNQRLNLQQLWANMHVQLYALDFEGDCNCPTFSKQGAGINKGLFFHLSPGIGWYGAQTEYQIINSTDRYEKEGLVFRVGGGLGLDLGVSDLLTITPQISYFITSEMNSELGPELSQAEPVVGSYSKQIQFSLRFGFRPDYGRSGRYR